MSMRKLLLGLLLCLPLTAQAAAIHFIACTSDTSGTPNVTAAFTPTAGRLVVVTSTMSGSVTAISSTAVSSVGGDTYTAHAVAGYPTVQDDHIIIWVANQTATASSQTITIDAADPGTGTNTCIFELSGMSRAGSDAVEQVSASDNDNSAGATPTMSFGANVQTGNPTLAAIVVASSAPALTVASGWTDVTSAVGHLTPNQGTEVGTRDSGFTGQTITWGGTYGANGAAVAVEFDASAAAFTAGPSNGGTTTTTLVINFTTNIAGTVEGVACPDGQAAPTATQVLADQCTGDVAAVAHFDEVVVSGVADTETFTGLVASTTYDTHYVIDALVDSGVVALANQTTAGGGAPTFTLGPSEAPATNGFTISGTITCTGTCTVEAVACNPGDAVPTSNEIEAGQCGGGNAALMNASEVWTTGVANDFLLTSANKPVRFDVYVSGTDGTTDTAVTTMADQDRSIRSGFLFVVMASHSATGLCNEDAYYTPDCADGVGFEYEDDTNESADCNANISVTGDLVLTPVAPGDCGGPGERRTLEISYQDVSNATDGLFTAPTVGNFTTDDTLYVNNSVPDFGSGDVEFLWQRSVAITSVPLEPRWSDIEADALTITYQDALPAGLSNTAETLGGTPTTCGTSTVTERATDTPGDYSEIDNTMVVGELVPATADQSEASAIAEIEGFCSFDAVAGTPEYSASVALGNVIRTDPASGWLSPPTQVVTYTLSLGPVSVGAELKTVYILVSDAGLTRWVDYIPVSYVSGCAAGRYDADGCWAVDVIASTAGLTAWTDYIPVFEVAQTANKWRYENDGWIPVNTITP